MVSGVLSGWGAGEGGEDGRVGFGEGRQHHILMQLNEI